MNWGGVWSGLRAAGHAVFYATMALVCVAFVVMGAIQVAPMGDDVNAIVHTAAWTHAGLWFPWVGAGLTAVAMWVQRRRWGRDTEARRYRARHSEPAALI